MACFVKFSSDPSNTTLLNPSNDASFSGILTSGLIPKTIGTQHPQVSYENRNIVVACGRHVNLAGGVYLNSCTQSVSREHVKTPSKTEGASYEASYVA